MGTVVSMKDEQLLRYSRHIMLPQVDIAGQEKICNGRVLIVGLGGLGSPAALYLGASGVGTLVLVDDDTVEESNLQRQVAHTEARIGQNKAESAKRAILDINRDVSVETYTQRLKDQALAEQVQRADVVLDCTDNFSSRKAINHMCVQMQTPLVSGAAIRLEGQLTVFDKRDADSPCYQCLYQLTDDENLSCAQSGVLSPLVGVVGTMQALEALKVLGGFGQPLVGRLGLYDAVYGEWRYMKLKRDNQCEVCGHP